MPDPKQQSVSSFSGHSEISRPPGLLVSVRDLAEARLCLGSGIDILDLKEPNNGALGAVNVETMAAVISCLARHSTAKTTRLSFAAGELVDWDQSQGPRLVDRYDLELVENFQYVKIGLAHAEQFGDWQPSWNRLFSGLPTSTQPVAVGYFDHASCNAPSIDEIIEFARESSLVRTVLLDTFCKKHELFEWVADQQLASVIEKCHRGGLSVVVAGSVNESNLHRVKSLCPDFVGVRGAICQGGRRTKVKERLLQDFIFKLQQNVPLEE